MASAYVEFSLDESQTYRARQRVVRASSAVPGYYRSSRSERNWILVIPA
jgi:hypothetical protein